MNIIWLDQLDFLKANGGGEFYKKALYNYLKDVANVEYFTPNYYIDCLSADVFIFSDLFNQPSLHPRQWFDQSSILNITKNFKYITMDTGFSTICDKDYFPCNGIHFGCSDCFCKGKRLDFLRQYYKNATATIFLSPLHQKTIEAAIETTLNNVILMRPPIDYDKFYSDNQDRPIDILYVGVLNEAKGLPELIHSYGNTNKNVVLIGHSLYGGKLPENFTHIDHINRNELPQWYARSKSFWAKVVWHEPFGLTTAEAAIAGCSILSNERSGAMSWNTSLRERNFYRQPGQEIWEKIINL